MTAPSTQPQVIAPRTVHDLSAGAAERTAVPAPRSRWIARLLVPGVIFLAALVMVLAASWDRLVPATPVRVVPVVVKSVQGEEAGSVTVQAPGWLEPAPYPHYASALADGIVDEVLVLEGQRVEAGQPVARLIDDDARLGLARAQASLELQQAELEGTKATLQAAERSIETLIAPRRAALSSEARVAEVDAGLARLAADLLVEEAKLAEIEDELRRKSELLESRAVSEADLRRLQLRAEAQKGVVESTRAESEVLRALRRQAVADRDAARQSLELLIEEQRALQIAQAAVRRAEAAVRLAEVARDEAALRLDRMVVRAPVAGVVMTRLVSPGSRVASEGAPHSAHVVHLYDPSSLQVRVDVPLADAASVGVGQLAEIIVDALPDRIFGGRVTRLVHEADIAKNTVEVKVGIDEPVEQLKPQMLARVRFLSAPEQQGQTAQLRQRVFAPSGLLQGLGDGQATVLVVGSLEGNRGVAERRAVRLGGMRVDGWQEIAEGLRPGDLLVANPPADLEPRQRVRVLGESSLEMNAGDR